MGGRGQEAIAEANRAHQLDPLSQIITRTVGAVHRVLIRQLLARLNGLVVLPCVDACFSEPLSLERNFSAMSPAICCCNEIISALLRLYCAPQSSVLLRMLGSSAQYS